MGKYMQWVLNKRELTPLSNVTLVDATTGYVRRHIHNIYECPHCHKTTDSLLTNECNIRKCRWCKNSVSPYKGDTRYYVFLPESVNTIEEAMPYLDGTNT